MSISAPANDPDHLYRVSADGRDSPAARYVIFHPDDSEHDIYLKDWASNAPQAVGARFHAGLSLLSSIGGAGALEVGDGRDLMAAIEDSELYWATSEYLKAVHLIRDDAPTLPDLPMMDETRIHECVILPDETPLRLSNEIIVLGYFLVGRGFFVAVIATIPEPGLASEVRSIFVKDPSEVALFRLLHWVLHNPDLMEKTVIDTARPPSKKARRRGAVHKPSPVTIVDLRASHRAARADVERAESTYRSRWIVRGHWHRYWTGPRDDRKLEPRYVMPYVKGPDGAPLNETTRVSVW